MEKKNKNIKLLIIGILSVVAIIVAVCVALILINVLGVDTSVATPDEATPDETTVITTVPENTEVTTPNGKVYNIKQDWNELASINSEIVGWINMPGTIINYPVLKHSGDGPNYQYYLHRNYDESYYFAGSIFIDYRSSNGVKSRNIITHGHHMNDGSMYGALLGYGKYTGNVDFYKQCPTLFFNTPAGNEQWIVFSVYKTNTLEAHGAFFNYLMGSFDSDAQYMNYIYNVKIRSLIDVPVPINENDQIITLSTCSYEYSDFRTVVVARKIRPGEDVRAYVSNATVNNNAVWPEVYYRDNGGTRPKVTTFKTELGKGNITWYDGSGKLSGNEWLKGVAGNSTFTVTFLDYDGSILTSQTVSQGRDAVAPPNPVKPDDNYYTYTFIGWQLDYHNVKCDMTIAPSFKPELKEQYR